MVPHPVEPAPRPLAPSAGRCLGRLLIAFTVIDATFALLLSAGYAQISRLPGWTAMGLALAVTAPVLVTCNAVFAVLARRVHRLLQRAGQNEAALLRAARAFQRLPRHAIALEALRWLAAFGVVFALERPAHWQPPVFFLITLGAGTLAIAHPLTDWCLAPAATELWRAMHARGLALHAPPIRLATRLAIYSTSVVAATSAYFACFAFAARLKLLAPESMLISILVFSGSALFFSLVCAFLLSTTFTRPLREMSEIISQISSDERLSDVDRVPLHQGDELGTLALLTNTMIDRLERTARERAAALRSLGTLNQTLERRVAERTQQLTVLQDLAVASAHHAGMSEIATNVLHNVGNVLTSVNVSCDHLEHMFAASRVPALGKVTALLRDHGERAGDYLTSDPIGRRLPEYLVQVGELLVDDHAHAQAELANLRAKIELINDVVTAQQQYATGAFLSERADVAEIVDDILEMQADSLRARAIRVVRDTAPVQPIAIQRSKLAHVLVNLMKNADEAMAALRAEDRVLTIETGGGARPFIRVHDTGAGIAPDVLDKIFQHGFTTKPTGHGFGLHACANAMTEMGGSISATSDGPGRGATFTLRFAAA